MAIFLSKSKIKQGMSCIKALHLSVHQPKLAQYSSQSQKAFSHGMEVGKIARSYFPQGILIKDFKWADKMSSTKLALKTKKPIFEATLSFNNVPIQVDILEPCGEMGYNLIEVKSGLSAKDDYIEDASIQLYVLEGLGVKINQVFIWHINKQASGEADLFTKVDVSSICQIKSKEIPAIVAKLQDAVKDPKAVPQVSIGSHCSFPYECPFKNVCWANVPKTNSIFQIPYFAKKWEAYKDGVVELTDPRLVNYDIRPEIIEAVLNNKMWINEPAIVKALESWKFPLNSLDFETFQVGIPHLEKTYPYQQIPFQFSIHSLEKGELEAKHFDYLHQSDSDPREMVAQHLVQYMPSEGTILAYNGKFEAQVCSELMELFPQYKEALQSIINRLEDPWLLLKEHLYHPAFLSSYSLKSVAPVLLGKEQDYKTLAIKDGLEAQAAFAKLLKTDNVFEKISINKNLRDYCKADTYNLILLYFFLAKTTKYSI